MGAVLLRQLLQQLLQTDALPLPLPLPLPLLQPLQLSLVLQPLLTGQLLQMKVLEILVSILNQAKINPTSVSLFKLLLMGISLSFEKACT